MVVGKYSSEKDCLELFTTLSGSGRGKIKSGFLLKVTKPADTAPVANFANCEFRNPHPQDHHLDEKVVNPQSFAQLILAGCSPFLSCKTQQKSALCAVQIASQRPNPADSSKNACRACTQLAA
jgi:hypothetical protein